MSQLKQPIFLKKIKKSSTQSLGLKSKSLHAEIKTQRQSIIIYRQKR